MTDVPRILVGTLCCGERERPMCADALAAQRGVAVESFALENLPEADAHHELYQRFMAGADDFDLFLKLDADMVLHGADKLAAAAALFRADDSLDHAIFRVHDWMTDAPIIGIHMFSRRARWPERPDPLFADPPPVVPGRRRYVLRRPPSPLALHGPDPSPLHAFHFGLHRALKAVAPGRSAGRRLHRLSHWRMLRRLWPRFLGTRDRRIGLALLGVEHALSARPPAEACGYGHPELRRAYEAVAAMSADAMYERLEPAWGSPRRRAARWRFVLAPAPERRAS